MKFFLLIATLLACFGVDARYVTKSARDTARKMRRNLEFHYGHGLVGLIHPVTNAFNHDAVIERRGGRHQHEKMGTLGDWGVHHVLGAIHGLVGQDNMPQKWQKIADKEFDRYDVNSFFYGWILALQDKVDDAVASNCFISSFETVTEVDLLLKDLDNIFKDLKLFDLAVYTPTKVMNNFATAYQ